MSRVANNPINVPDAVNVSINDNVVVIKGNKGEIGEVRMEDESRREPPGPGPA